MKKSLLALAILGAFAGAASAQSSVTIYGIVDTNVEVFDNGASGDSRTTRMGTGGFNSSRFGFKGTEDLGGGLKANFVLEANLNSDDGTATAGFSRLAFVGLQGGFGAVNLGRQVSPIKDAYGSIDPFGDTGAPAIGTNFFGGSAGNFSAARVSDTLKYESANFGGFSGKASYTFGGTADGTSTNSTVGLGLAYVNGPLNVQFGAADGESDFPATPNDNQAWFLGTTYNFGVAKLALAYAEYERENAAGTTTIDGRNALIGVTVPLGASTVKASYSMNENRLIDDADTQRLALMYSYDLSKRTSLYTSYVKIRNDAGARLQTGGTTAASNGDDPTLFNVGVSHKF